jgi:hypothetical protein
MIDDDDSYELNDQGIRVLIGLTVEETAEFSRLDGTIGHGRPPGISLEQWAHAEDRRWLELYQKHENARQPFLQTGKTRH